MIDPRREILAAVARGELSPEEGAARLEEVGSPPPRPAIAELLPPSTPQAPAISDLRAVRVVRSLGTAEIVGDPSVLEAVAEGPHVAERDGDTLVIRSSVEDGTDIGSYFRYRAGGINIRTGPRGRGPIGHPDFQPLRVRMNPNLALELEGQAGTVRVRDVRGPIKAAVQAGALNVEGFRGPLDLSVQAGSLRGAGILDHGLSRISCEAGSVNLQLERGSSVKVKARSTLGKISLGESDTVSIGGGAQELVLGAGEATLEVDATMGSIRIAGDS